MWAVETYLWLWKVRGPEPGILPGPGAIREGAKWRKAFREDLLEEILESPEALLGGFAAGGNFRGY